MKGLKFKALAALIAAAYCLMYIPVFAYDLPNAFWSLNDSYSAAQNSKDYSGIAYYGSRVIDLISAEPSNEQTDNIMGSRTYDTAFAYFFCNDYENAAKYFNMYIPYGKKMGWSDGVRISEEFVKQLTSDLSVYKHTKINQKSYAAKNEPSGVLTGQISERSEQDDSVILLYQEYGHINELDWAGAVFKDARENNKSIELALNFPNQGDTARSISTDDEYLSALYNLILQYTDVPVYCRIGAEVNIWNNTCTPQEFKKAFCIIADKMRELSNVAIVCSVAHTDPWKSEARPYTTDDYYPGDDLVDYVGVTVYCNKFFEGRIWNGVEQFNEICFKTGYSADPVLMIKDFVERYGLRKPVMISECGSAYYTGGEICQNDQKWAADRVRDIYGYIPMVYPQVKLMAYFNKRINEEVNWYDLDSSAELKSAYDEMKVKPWFIHENNKNAADVYFEKISGVLDGSSSVTVSAYPHLYGSDSISVEYYLDGKWAATADKPPYTAIINPAGAEKLSVVAVGNNGNSITKEYGISGSGAAADDIGRLNEAQLEALNKIRNKGIMTGYEDGSIRPYNNITRAEFAAMICRMNGYAPNGKCDFDDARGHWASGYIRACTDVGAINGVGDNMFAPDENITMEQAFKIVTVTRGVAKSNAEYPKGFVLAAAANGLTDNLTTGKYTTELKRVDAAMIMSNAVGDI